MSPEQGKGDQLDARSDLYSVGVMLFQLLTGRLPFQAETALGLVYKQVHDRPPRPSDVKPGVDPYLEKVCLKALAKRPADRYQTAREMRSALRGRFPDASSRFPLAMTSQPELHRESLEQAETQVLQASGATLEEAEGEEAPRASPIGTPGGTAALPSLPVVQPNIWMLGGLALLVGAGATALAVTHWSTPTDHASATGAVEVVDAGPSAGLLRRVCEGGALAVCADVIARRELPATFGFRAVRRRRRGSAERQPSVGRRQAGSQLRPGCRDRVRRCGIVQPRHLRGHADGHARDGHRGRRRPQGAPVVEVHGVLPRCPAQGEQGDGRPRRPDVDHRRVRGRLPCRRAWRRGALRRNGRLHESTRSAASR